MLSKSTFSFRNYSLINDRLYYFLNMYNNKICSDLSIYLSNALTHYYKTLLNK